MTSARQEGCVCLTWVLFLFPIALDSLQGGYFIGMETVVSTGTAKSNRI